MSILLLLVFILGLYQLPLSTGLKCGTNRADRYEVVSTPMSWSDARQHCQTLGNADLLVLNNDVERDFIRNLSSVILDGYWIGLSDLNSEGDFRWINKKRDKENEPGWLWHVNEPTNNHAIINEDCGLFTKGSTPVYGVHDRSCLDVNKAICEDDNDPCTAEQYYSAESCDLSNRYREYMGVLNIGYNWGDANVYCANDGLVIASLSTEAEVRYVRQMLLNSDLDYWIGLNDKNEEGVWKWNNHGEYGEELDDLVSHRWNRHEPNGGLVEHCGEFKIDSETGIRGLNDEDCSSQRSFICEMKRCREGNLIIEQNHLFLNHVLYSVEVKQLNRCAKACLKNKACHSVNLVPIEGGIGYICELSNSTRADSATDYVQHDGAVYAGFK